MKVEFYVEDEFLAQSKRLSKKYHSLKSDLKLFRKSLEEDPFQGSNLGKGVKKVRMARLPAKARAKAVEHVLLPITSKR